MNRKFFDDLFNCKTMECAVQLIGKFLVKKMGGRDYKCYYQSGGSLMFMRPGMPVDTKVGAQIASMVFTSPTMSLEIDNKLKVWIIVDRPTKEYQDIDILSKMFSSYLSGLYYKMKSDEMVENIFTAIMEAFDKRDYLSTNHSQRVRDIAVLIAMQMGFEGHRLKILRYAAWLHDIGKIGVREYILFKSGKLTKVEREAIQKHVVNSYEILKDINLYDLNPIKEIILYHHERCDGSGYPYHLKCHQIPLESQIIAVADSFDAIVSPRHFKRYVDVETAVNEIYDGRGTLYRNDVVDAFLELDGGEVGKIIGRKIEYKKLKEALK